MIRLPVPPARIAARVEPTAQERHYLLTVLRLKPGDALEVFDGKGGRYPARLLEDAVLELGERVEEAPRAPLILAQGLAKGDKVELVVEKATELGATGVWPFSSERAVVQLTEEKAKARVERWQKIAAAAARQCGRADIPDVAPVVGFAAAVERARSQGLRAIVLYEGEKQVRMRDLLRTDEGLVLFAGPEGGFSEAEIERARTLGAEAASLGERILRTETVALAALSAVAFARGELG